MTDEKGATPPKGGRMDHEAMRRASELPVEGPAATDAVAASGGLELPGRTGTGNTADQRADRADAEREPPVTELSVEKLERQKRREDPDGR